MYCCNNIYELSCNLYNTSCQSLMWLNSHILYIMLVICMPHKFMDNFNTVEYHSNRIVLMDNFGYMHKMNCHHTINMGKYVHKYLEDLNMLLLHLQVDNLYRINHWINCTLLHILDNLLDLYIPSIKLDILCIYSLLCCKNIKMDMIKYTYDFHHNLDKELDTISHIVL